MNYYGYNAESSNTKTGLQYLRARYYDPATGRFISEDTESGTKENPLTRNSYLYVLNNPLNYCDPTGKFFKELWNGVKKAVKKVGNFVNEHVVKPIKKAVSWVADKASSAVKAVSNWWDKVTGRGNSGSGKGKKGVPSPSAASYQGDLGGYPGNPGGSSYAAMDLQTKASYMSDQEIGQLEKGWDTYVTMQQKADDMTIPGDVLNVLSNISISVSMNVTSKDRAKFVIGLSSMAGGVLGMLAGGVSEVLSGGGSSAVSLPVIVTAGSAAAAGAGVAVNALGNMFHFEVSINSDGKGEAESETKSKPGNKPYKNNKEANKQAQKHGYKDAHELKADYVGKSNVSKYDMKYDTKTGEIYLESKDGKTQIPTGLTHEP